MGKAVNIPLTRTGSHPLGCHRVLSPPQVLPQAAEILDPSLPIYADEVLLQVDCLHLDSASLRQLKEVNGPNESAVAEAIEQIVGQRGKMQNPVTGSGGMLLGTVAQVGPQSPHDLAVGDRVATLVSLTLTPLALQVVRHVDLETGRVEVSGHAILFPSGIFSKMPADLPEDLALAALDVCGAPAWVKRLVQSQDKVLVLGTGKAGLLATAAALDVVAPQQVCTLDLRKLGEGFWPEAWRGIRSYDADAGQAVAVWEFLQAKGEGPFDLVIHTCNAPETETLALLAVKTGGTVLFFNMATSFSRAVLTAEGVGKDARLLMGNGYAEGHTEYTLNLLRRHDFLRKHLGGNHPQGSGR